MNLVEILSVIAAAFGASLLVLHGEGIVQIPLAVRVTIGLFLATIPVAPTAAAYLSEKRAVGKEVASHYEWIRKFMVYAHLPAKAVLGRREKAVAAEALVDGSGRLTVRVAVISLLIPELSHPQEEYIAIYSLALQQSGTLEIGLGIEISQYMQSRGLVDLAELEAPTFLTGFYRTILNPRQRNTISDIFSDPTSTEIEAALSEVTRRYFEGPYLRYFENVMKNEKDLRKILVNLARGGEYLAAEVGEEARSRIERELKALLKASSPVLVLKAETGGGKKAIKEAFQGIPRLGGQGYITGIPGTEARPFGLWVVKPLGHLSVDEFTRDLQSKILRATEGLPGYQAVVRVYGLMRQKTFTEEIATAGKVDNAYLLKSKSSLAYFDEEERTEDIEALTNRVFIPAEDILLKLLPFNLFFPEGTDSERGFLYRSYQRAKRAFGVERLTDWRTRDPARLASFLMSVGKPSYTDDEAVAVYGVAAASVSDLDVRQRLLAIAKIIVNRSGDYEKSFTI